MERAAALLATDPAAAERMALAWLARAPGDPRAVLILASAERRRGHAASARRRLEPLALAHPRAANTHYELGLAREATGDPAGAVAALRQAVAAHRELPAAWRALGDLLFRGGDTRGAEAAYAEHLRASVTAPELKLAADALARGDPAAAEPLVRRHLSRTPRDGMALQMLGDALTRLSRQPEAEAVLALALDIDPGFDGARFGLANALFQQQKAAEALPHVHRLLAADPRDPAYRNLLAACLALVGDPQEVDALYRDLLAEFPNQPKLQLNHGHALRTIDRAEEATAAYRRALALDPGLGDAYWSLANLKTACFSEGEVQGMRSQLARANLSQADRLHLNFALGKALEDRRDFAGSFAAYAAGAAIRRSELGYSADRTTADLARAGALFTPEFLAERAGGGAGAPDPIFVVGLPRSGSTLVEQILASHSAIEGTMELPDLGLIARSLSAGGRDPLDALAALPTPAFARLGERYLADTRIHRKLGRPRFIDKMPNNFLHLGLIHLMLPNAAIIDVRRHPLGSGFGAFKQHFAQGQSFSYDLADIGRYYRDYVAWMAHVDAVLPGRVHRVIYEDLVSDTEGEVRRLLHHLGLPFEEAALRFWETERTVKTVSSEQVRRPIFTQGLDQWRNYEPWLDPLKAALGPALETWRNPPSA